MDTYDAISKRASVREYLQKPIPKEILEKLVDAGRRAPSARAVEPWEFVVVTDKNTLGQIAALAPNARFLKDAAASIVVISKDTKYYLEDGCAATENILLMAADLGLGACWIAGSKKDYRSAVISVLGAPQEMELISMISLGWPKTEPSQHKVRFLKEVIHWGEF